MKLRQARKISKHSRLWQRLEDGYCRQSTPASGREWKAVERMNMRARSLRRALEGQ